MSHDKLTGFGLALVGIIAAIATLQIPGSAYAADPGPKLFPMIAAGTLFICGLGILLSPKSGTADETPALPGELPAAPGGNRRGLILALALILHGMLLWLVGFIVASVIMVTIYYLLLSPAPSRRVWKGLVLGVLVTSILHLGFSTALNTYMPQGILF